MAPDGQTCWQAVTTSPSARERCSRRASMVAAQLQARDRDDGKAIGLTQADEFGQPHHLAVLGDDLRDDPDGHETGEFHEVDGSLGVAGAHAHSAVARPQRQDVAGAT